MKLGLNGRVALITGGSQGIGKGIAMAFAEEGVKVAICARHMKELLIVKKAIEKSGGKAIAISADATDTNNVKAVIKKVITEFGGLDILVNNVGGVDKYAGFMELENDDWQAAFKSNVMPVVNFTKLSLPWLKKSVAPRIINISSISGVQPGFYNPHYTTTKAAVINLSKYLSNEFAKDKILVNVVCPGPVHSRAWDRNVKHIADLQNISFAKAKIIVDDEEEGKILLGRVGEAEDIAGMVLFLSSDKATWITGACFHINGGKLRTII